jgi:D-alanyl-D-alanine endopeptidase (penicillin-binding protein 7)
MQIAKLREKSECSPEENRMKSGSSTLPKLLAAALALGIALAAPASAALSADKPAAAKPGATRVAAARSAKATPPRSKAAVAKAGSGKPVLAKARVAKPVAKTVKTRMSRQQRLAAKKAAAEKAAAVAAARELNHYATDGEGNPLLRSAAVLVQDQSSGEVLFEKNSDAVLPIASITKLMTAMVVLDAKQGLHEVIDISSDEVDMLRGTRSRLAVGTELPREDMLRLALMSSENRAAAALARHYPGATPAFIEAMNAKAKALGLQDTRFYDSTGLNAANVSSARDLSKMVAAAAKYPLIREFSTSAEYTVEINGRPRAFHNTNALVRNSDWEIGVSKTGFISEAGRCLVMQAWLNHKPMIIVLLDSWGKLSRIGDANRIKRWLESASLAGRQPG